MESASGPRSYRVVVEEADGSTHDHQLVLVGRELILGDVLEAGQDGWAGPRVTIEEIDRHPDANNAGEALAWPLRTLPRMPTPRVAARRTLA